MNKTQFWKQVHDMYPPNTKCDRCGWPSQWPTKVAGQNLCPLCRDRNEQSPTQPETLSTEHNYRRAARLTHAPTTETPAKPPPKPRIRKKPKPARKPKGSRRVAEKQSGYRGVHWMKKNKCWMTSIMINGEKHYLGCSKDPAECSKWYEEAKESGKVIPRVRKPNPAHTKESREKIGDALRGRRQTPEHIAKRMASKKRTLDSKS